MFSKHVTTLCATVGMAGLLLGAAHASTRVFSGAGLTDATNAINAFRAAIGGNNNGSNPPQISGRREINWDGVKLDGTDFGGNTLVIDLNHTVGIPVDRFQSRGVIFQEVYAVSGDGFASVNPDTAGHFPAFSPNNTFAMFNENTIEQNFVLASTPGTTPLQAGSRGFGAIFLDVNTANTSKIKYLHGSTVLGEYSVPASPVQGDVEFLGVLFDNPLVTRVELTLGNATLFFFDGHTVTPGGTENLPYKDLAVVDDFVYAEPVIAPISLSLSPASVIGGYNVTGKITLNVPAPSGGITVSLASSNPAIANPTAASITIPAGAQSGTFTIKTHAVYSLTKVTIAATVNGISKSKVLKISP